MNSFNPFSDFFKTATGHHPFNYQTTLATNDDDLPQLFRVPTGCGKTAAITLAWLWRRKRSEFREMTPRRLIYCLPMRVLVEQTARNIETWLANLGISDGPDGVRIYILMGGEDPGRWDFHPEQDMIILGTQDMLLSRALNRGYSMSRFRWPIHYGFFNNDCIWVMDEVQLMGPGLTTSLQLDAFRDMFGTFGNNRTVWMSATCEREWLETVDKQAPDKDETYSLDYHEVEKELSQRVLAKKTVENAGVSLVGTSKEELEEYHEKLSKKVLQEHLLTSGGCGDLTLVVMNTVDRAQGLYQELKKIMSSDDSPDLRLLHSRFRPQEKSFLTDLLNQRPGDKDFPKRGRIFVATQIVEAGVDISSKLMFTELAPWTSIVQRLGRLNREGEHENGNAYWIDIKLDESKGEKNALPYSTHELEASRNRLDRLTDVSPMSLSEIESPAPQPCNVIRKKDVIQTYDTSGDLSGNDVDISGFIRDEGVEDVHVFWREWDGENPSEDLTPSGEELCPVTVYALREYSKKKEVWGWDHLNGSWTTVRGNQIFPGRDYLILATSGGYDDTIGWSPRLKTTVRIIDPISTEQVESTSEDPETSMGRWQTLEEHTDEVVKEICKLIDEIGGLEEFRRDLILAARFHDLGKAHHIFQEAILSKAEKEGIRPSNKIWSKSGGQGLARYKRKYFRHELASALATLQYFNSNSIDNELAVYLIAAHHGKVRCSIRSLPDEQIPDCDDERRYARGIWERDVIPSVNLGGGIITDEISIDMSPMELGCGSCSHKPWYDMTSQLRDRNDLGPYRLAFLETLLRIADWRASINDEGGGYPD